MNEQVRAFLIYSAMLLSVGGSGGFAGGRMTAPEQPAEVRIVRMPPRVVRMLPPPAAPVAPVLPEAPAPPAPVQPSPPIAEPPVIAPPVVEAPPLPPPRSKVDRPKPPPKPKQPLKAPPAAAKKHKALPSCAEVQREYDAMNYAERIAAYYRASPEEIAHGKRCLGL